MTRVSPRLLLAFAALLLVAWIVVPVSTSPPSSAPGSPAAVLQELTPSPELEAINREVDRLRDRLAEPARNTVPVRDPFQFAESERVRLELPPAGEPSPIMVAAAPVVAWPRLVAILASGDDAAPVWRAVFEDRAQLVQIRSVGETIGDVAVTDVSGDSATLTHTPSGETTRVPLR
jgi:hypothetical protein